MLFQQKFTSNVIKIYKNLHFNVTNFAQLAGVLVFTSSTCFFPLQISFKVIDNKIYQVDLNIFQSKFFNR